MVIDSAQDALMLLALVVGLPAGAWAHLSLRKELDDLEQRCADCAHCRAKKQEQEDQEREARAGIDRRFRR